MKQELLDLLLFQTLDWGADEIGKHRELISDFAELKYNTYEQFVPGGKFIEGLIIWLRMFPLELRQTMFDFLFDKVVYISPAEMNQLVSMVYSDAVLPFLMAKAEELVLPQYCNYCDAVTLLREKSLFLAMSDGARIGEVRRFSSLSNEQVLPDYRVDEAFLCGASIDTKARLRKQGLASRKWETMMSDDFSYIFLLDDFAGSGKTCIRWDCESLTWKGKIPKVVSRFRGCKGIKGKLRLVVVLYLASAAAKENILKGAQSYSSNPTNDDIEIADVIVLQEIPALHFEEHDKVLEGLKYYDKACDGNYITESYRVGKCDAPYLGFDEGAIPLVIHHNTPNNAPVALWYPVDKALFPRVARHKE